MTGGESCPNLTYPPFSNTTPLGDPHTNGHSVRITLKVYLLIRSGSVKSILLRPFLKMLKIVEFIKILKIVDFGFLSFVVKMLKILNY